MGQVETEAERIQRINEELIEYGEWVTDSIRDEDSGSGDLNDALLRSSYVLAEMGVFGGGDGGNDIYSGPASSAGAMELAQQFLDSMNAPGTSGNPSGIYRDVFSRLLSTDIGALSPQDQIAVTHGALLIVEPYVLRDVMRAMVNRLDRAGRDYRLAVLAAERTGLYPEYLNENGYATAL